MHSVHLCSSGKAQRRNISNPQARRKTVLTVTEKHPDGRFSLPWDHMYRIRSGSCWRKQEMMSPLPVTRHVPEHVLYPLLNDYSFLYRAVCVVRSIMWAFLHGWYFFVEYKVYFKVLLLFFVSADNSQYCCRLTPHLDDT